MVLLTSMRGGNRSFCSNVSAVVACVEVAGALGFCFSFGLSGAFVSIGTSEWLNRQLAREQVDEGG